MSTQPTELTAEDQVAVIGGSAQWLAAVLGTATLPGGYTIALFHEGVAPIEHLTLGGRPVHGDNSGELFLATFQYLILSHQMAHFAATASDEDWEAAMTRATELGDFDGELTVQGMRDGRAGLQAAKGGMDGLAAALAAAGGPKVHVVHDASDLKRLLAAEIAEADTGPEAEPSRGQAISYL